MTIQELYQWASQNNLENYELVLNTSTGESTSYYSAGDFIVNDNSQEISF